MSGPFARSKNVATGLELSSLEFDQRLASAFASTSFGTDGGFASDRFVFENILRLNIFFRGAYRSTSTLITGPQ
jgi:hypothetical protein